MININDIREDFPILKRTFHDHPLAYLDTANSAQKPQQVIDKVKDFYTHSYANIHRGVYTLSNESTESYENVRTKVQSFINAPDHNSIIFTKGATESINLLASSLGYNFFAPGDEIILSEMEHHSNIVPWQMLQARTGIKIKVIPIFDDGSLDIEAYQRLLKGRVRLVAITHMSNVLGTVNPIKEMVAMAHDAGALFFVDGCQAVAHMPVDVQDLDCDFYAFSSHKLYAPTGAGVLYGKHHLLENLPPYQTGGSMIQRVSFEKTTFKASPYRFEAGTPPIVQVIGLGTAIDYISFIGFEYIQRAEKELLQYAQSRLLDVPHLRIIGTAANKSCVMSFVIDDIHPHDIATFADHNGVAIRAGHHCAQPLMARYRVAAMSRASLGLYNSQSDIDQLIESLHKTCKFFNP